MAEDPEELAALKHEVSVLKEQVNGFRKMTGGSLPDESRASIAKDVMASFIEASVTPLVLIDQEFNVTRINAAHAAICEREISECVGCNYFEICPLKIRQIFDRVIRTKKGEEGKAHSFGYSDHSGRGATYWNWKLTPLLDANLEMEFLVFSLEDVTGQVEGEEDLRNHETKFRPPGENVVNGFVLYEILLDNSGRVADAVVVDVNSAWEKIMGHAKSEVLGKSLFRLCPWVEQDWFDIYDRIARTGVPIRMDCHGMDIDGEFDAHYYIPQPGYLAATLVEVTERAKEMETGRTWVAELEDLYNNAPCGYHSLDRDGVIVRINDTELAWLGYTRDEVIGKMRFSDVLTPASYRIYRKNFPRFKELGYVRDLEFEVVRKDGSILSVMVSATAITDADGNYVMSRSTVFDVTRRREVVQSLLESEERFRTAFEYASIGKALTAPDGRLIKVNRAFCEMVGYTEEELTSTDFSAITHPDDIAKSRESIRCLMAGERRTCQFEKRYVHKDGHVIFVSASTILLRDGEGNPRYLISDFMDVTDHWKADQRISRLNRVYSVLTNINEVIVRVRSVGALYDEACRIAVEDGRLRMVWIGMVDETTGIVKPVASSGVVEGYLDRIIVASRDNRHGRGPTGTCIREDRYTVCNDFRIDPRMGPWRREALKRGYLSSAAFPLHKGNQVVGALMLYAGEPEFFDDEEIRVFLSLADDISFAIEFMEQEDRRRKAEAQVRRLNDELEQRVILRTEELKEANKQLETFSYTVSHDLRAPLRAINGFANILAEDYLERLDEDGRGYLTRIQRNTHRMDALINGLLDLSRVGRATIQLSELDMGIMAEDVYGELSALTPERATQFEIKTCPRIRADRALMYQVLQNLIGNAIKFTQLTAEPKIEFGGDMVDGEAIFYVRDNGAGFDSERAGQLFGAFRRLHSEKEFEGTGVGLALVRRIITAHGGRVWAEGKVDKGACFYFGVPA